jgi:hypothetical protein
VKSGAEISSDSVIGGSAGIVNVNARDAVVMSDAGAIFSRSLLGGRAGEVVIDSPNIDLTDTKVSTDAVITDERAGSITLRAEQGTIRLTRSQITTANRGSGSGGAIDVMGTVLVLDDASLTTSSTSTGPAGDIHVDAERTLTLRDGSHISAQSNESAGGRIDIHTGSMLRLVTSSVTTNVEGGASDAGNIRITGGPVVIDRSWAVANAEDGAAGSIEIAGRFSLVSPDSVVQATSNRDVINRVDVRNPISNLSGTLTVTPVEFLSAARLLRAQCAERYAGTRLSSFVVSPVRTVTPAPEAWRPMPLDGWRTPARQTASGRDGSWLNPFALWHQRQTPCAQ